MHKFINMMHIYLYTYIYIYIYTYITNYTVWI